MFFKYCLLVIRVYVMLNCYLKSQDTLAMTVSTPRVRGQGLCVPVGDGGTSNSTGRLKGRKNFQEEWATVRVGLEFPSRILGMWLSWARLSAVGLQSRGARWLLLLFLSQDGGEDSESYRWISGSPVVGILLPEGVPLSSLALKVLTALECEGLVSLMVVCFSLRLPVNIMGIVIYLCLFLSLFSLLRFLVELNALNFLKTACSFKLYSCLSICRQSNLIGLKTTLQIALIYWKMFFFYY